MEKEFGDAKTVFAGWNKSSMFVFICFLSHFFFFFLTFLFSFPSPFSPSLSSYKKRRYTAPEIYKNGWGAGGPGSDVWSFGLVLFELIKRDKPFRSVKENEMKKV